jgi:phage-related holin
VRAADRRTERSVQALAQRDRAPERGLPWWGALLALVAIAVVGGIIDSLGSIESKSGFNIGIVVASVIAIIAVKRSHMFPVVVAPPIVYSAAAVFQYYLKGSKTSAKLDIAANYLVYGFPAMATASAAVLIIAGIRLITRK